MLEPRDSGNRCLDWPWLSLDIYHKGFGAKCLRALTCKCHGSGDVNIFGALVYRILMICMECLYILLVN